MLMGELESPSSKPGLYVAMYTLIDPDTMEIVYAGKAVSPQKRYAQHADVARFQGNLEFHWWKVSVIQDRGTKPVMRVVGWVIGEEARKAEADFILQLWEEGAPLLNDNHIRSGKWTTPKTVAFYKRICQSEWLALSHPETQRRYQVWQERAAETVLSQPKQQGIA